MKRYIPYLSSAFLTLFGLLTLFLSSLIIFDLFDMRTKEGNFVPFIVWANFICSILYLLSAYGFIKNQRWTYQLLGISSVVLIVAFIGLLIHINSDGIYETRTIAAMIFRTTITLIFTGIAYLTLKKNRI